jgi:hypothetical protein
MYGDFKISDERYTIIPTKMTISLQQFCLLLFEPKILRGKYPAMFVSENKDTEHYLFLLLLSLELTGLVNYIKQTTVKQIRFRQN